MNNTGQDKYGSDSTGGSDFGDTEPAQPSGQDAPDARKIAQDWITLWQSELSAIAADPEIRESWQTMMAIWAGTMSALLRAAPREQDAPRHDAARGRATAADASRPPSAAASSDARDAEVERLARHVAALERRLAELELGSNPSKPPKRRP